VAITEGDDLVAFHLLVPAETNVVAAFLCRGCRSVARLAAEAGRKGGQSRETEFKYERGVQPVPKLGEWVEVLTEILEKEAKLPRRVEQLIKKVKARECRTFWLSQKTVHAPAPANKTVEIRVGSVETAVNRTFGGGAGIVRKSLTR